MDIGRLLKNDIRSYGKDSEITKRRYITMTKLASNDVMLFHGLMFELLFFANKKLNIIKNCSSKDDFFYKVKTEVEKTVPLRDKLFSDSTIIDAFVKENPEKYSTEELEIISHWKTSKKDDFILIKYTKEHALFYNLKDKIVYGVLGITDSFFEMCNGYSPVMIKIRLLPFKGKITYEGIFSPYNISFGSGIMTSIKIGYEAAMQKYGVITSLDVPVIEKKCSDEDMLRFYFKSKENRDRFYEEIEALKEKSPELEAIYYQEEASIIARDIKKSLKSQGIKGNFAVLVNTVVASGLTEKELENNIQKIVPADKQNWLYRFKL